MWAIAPHETYPGHHLQRLYQNENPRRLRVYESSYSNQALVLLHRMGADAEHTATTRRTSRTLHARDAASQAVAHGPRDHRLRPPHRPHDLRRCACSSRPDRIGFVRYGGQINIDGITTGGADTAAPTLGYFEWMLLREDYFKKMRELDQKGSLKDFHDRIYKIGFLPVTLVRESLMHQLEQQFRPRGAATSSQQ